MLGRPFALLKWSLFRIHVSHQEGNVHVMLLVCLKYQKLKELVDG